MDRESRALTEFSLDVDHPLVAVHSAINHGQSQTRAIRPFGRKERFETTSADVFGHAAPSVADLEDDPVTIAPRADADSSALRHGVHGVKNQIRQHLAQLTSVTGDGRD